MPKTFSSICSLTLELEFRRVIFRSTLRAEIALIVHKDPRDVVEGVLEVVNAGVLEKLRVNDLDVYRRVYDLRADAGCRGGSRCQVSVVFRSVHIEGRHHCDVRSRR